MKKSLFIYAAFGCLLLSSQPGFSRSFVSDPAQALDPITGSILSGQTSSSRPLQKSTALKHRLIATSYTNQTGLIDSSHFYYGSNTRGSDIANSYAFTDRYNPYDYGNLYSNFLYYPGYFNNVQNIKCDSTTHWNTSTGPFKKITAIYYTYNGNNDAIGQTYYQTTASPYSLAAALIMTYTAGDLTHFTYHTPTLNQAGDVTYNAQSRMVKDSVYNITSGDYLTNTYTYNASNDLTSALQVSTTSPVQTKIDYVYNTNHLLLSATKSTYNGTAWVNAKTDSFSYTGNNPLYSYFVDYTWSTTSNSWTPATKYTYHLDAQQRRDTVYMYIGSGNTWALQEKDFTVYDGNGLITEIRGIAFDGTQYAASPYDRNAYYYEDYNDPTAVNDLKNNNTLTVFPNPANNYISIQDPAAPAGQVSVTLVNTSGKIVLSLPGNLSTGVQNLYVGNLSAGIYWVLVRDSKGVVIGRNQFIRQ